MLHDQVLAQRGYNSHGLLIGRRDKIVRLEIHLASLCSEKNNDASEADFWFEIKSDDAFRYTCGRLANFVYRPAIIRLLGEATGVELLDLANCHPPFRLVVTPLQNTANPPGRIPRPFLARNIGSWCFLPPGHAQTETTAPNPNTFLLPSPHLHPLFA